MISGAVGFFLIGIHQLMTVGFANSYWAFMIMIVLFFGRLYRRGKEVQQEEAEKKHHHETQRKQRLKSKRKKKRK